MSDGFVLLLAVVACGWVVRLEWRRQDRRQLAARVGASLIAVGALAALALEPAVPRQVAHGRIVIATEGASRGFLRGIADSVSARQVMPLDSVGDLAALQRRFPSLTDVVIAGWGLPPHELVRARALRLSFAPAPLPGGVRFVSWPSRIVLGEEVPIRGRADPAAWVHLTGNGVTPDSARAGSDGWFEARFTPRDPGLVTFALQAGSATDTGAVDVRPRVLPAALILEGAPDFEVAHVRRWLARRGAPVGMRATVSRGRVRTYAINGAPVPVGALSAELLRRFDIAILDESAARSLSRAELALLRTAVTDDGLGILLTGAAPRLEGIATPPARVSRSARTIRVRTPGVTELSPPISSERLWADPGPAGSTVVESADGGTVVMLQAVGAGRVGFTAVKNPSRWLLEGESEAFERYWTSILARLARPKAAWRAPPPLPGLVGHPFRVTWPARLDSALVIGPDGTDTVFPTVDADSLSWSADFWPRVAGEHRVLAPVDTLRVFVAGEGTWHATRAAASAHATGFHAALHRAEVVSRPVRARAPVAPWIFGALFTAASSWLWWERRNRAWGKKEGRTGVG